MLVQECLVEALLVGCLLSERCVRRVEALMPLEQLGDSTRVSRVLDDRAATHPLGPEVDDVDDVIQRLTQRPVPEVEWLIQLRVGQVATQPPDPRRRPLVMSQ